MAAGDVRKNHPVDEMIHFRGRSDILDYTSVSQVDAEMQSGSAHGDSGGGLFLIGSDGGFLLAGITSGGYSENGFKESFYTNLSSTLIRTFLLKIRGNGADIQGL